MIKKLYYKKKQILLFVKVFSTTFFLLASHTLGEEKLLKEEKSYRDWSVFVSKDDPVTCFIASQSVKSEAFKNGQKLSSVNREKGTIYIIKKKNKENEYEGTFYAGYPLQVGSKAKLSIDKKREIVFFAHPSPKEKAEKEHAWAQKYDEEKLVSYLKKGSKAVLSAVSHRNTVTKDTFMLTGFSDALLELGKLCR
jgi:invasion protein IalB